jgi:hypothetical protein
VGLEPVSQLFGFPFPCFWWEEVLGSKGLSGPTASPSTSSAVVRVWYDFAYARPHYVWASIGRSWKLVKIFGPRATPS